MLTDARKEQLFQRGILDIAFSLRNSASGLSEPLTDEVAKEYEEYLDERLANWKYSTKRYEAVDELVRQLILAILQEIP